MGVSTQSTWAPDSKPAPSPDLSTISQALPNLSPEDLLSLHKNIQDLLPPPDDTEDSKLPALPAAILDKELSLGSLDQDNTLDNDDNLLKNTFDNYLPSPSLQNFTANI